ncbi:MAG: urea ABC transporter permease subunit UrtB [Pseudomonadota bacterium]|nr:urea ABC transporter permease subunit UrtB [Pseudomonadota bacterium]
MRILLAFIFALSCQWVIASPTALDNPSPQASFSSLVQQLPAASIKELSPLVDQLAATNDPKALTLLEALKDGQLYYTKDNKTVVRIIEENKATKEVTTETILEPLTTQTINTKTIKKIRVNNALRGQIGDYLSALKLFAEDETVRQAAIADFITQPDPEQVGLLQQAQANEQNEQLKAQLSIALASIDAHNSALPENQLAAVTLLAESQHMETFYWLERLQEKTTNPELKQAISTSMDSIQSRRDRYKMVENTFFGLSMGSVLLLAAIGLAITFGVMGVINMAHGEMIMIGAYATYVVQSLMPNHIGYSIWVAIPVAFLSAALVGILIERLVIKHLYGRPLETLLATFGISLILQQAARSLFGPLNQSVITPQWMSGSWEINPMLAFTYNRLYILFFALMVFFGLVLLLRKTSIGLHMRAVTQNRAMANSMGIRSGRVDALTFGLGSGIAGLAGVAISQLNNVGPNLGQSYIIDSFMVVVFGGAGNIFGTLYAAFGLGMINKYIEPFAGAVLAKILILVFIILFMQWRPRGMFAVKGRFVED